MQIKKKINRQMKGNENIKKGGIPKSMCPMVFGVTGTGRVA